jgi:hypothetical protein
MSDNNSSYHIISQMGEKGGYDGNLEDYGDGD